MNGGSSTTHRRFSANICSTSVCFVLGYHGIPGTRNAEHAPTYIWYCWWTKSCTTKDDDNPIRVLTIPGGAGFRPSTVRMYQIYQYTYFWTPKPWRWKGFFSIFSPKNKGFFSLNGEGFGPSGFLMVCYRIYKLGGGNSSILYFHPEPWGDDPIWRAYFSDGLVQPPTSTWLSAYHTFIRCPRAEKYRHDVSRWKVRNHMSPWPGLAKFPPPTWRIWLITMVNKSPK